MDKHCSLTMRTTLLACVCALAIALCATFAFPANAHAATKAMKAGTWYTATSADGYYKITATGEGVITLSIKGVKGKIAYSTGSVELLNAQKEDFASSDTAYTGLSGKTGSVKVAVSAGTYYAKLSRASVTSPVKIKYTFSSITQKLNCCKGNATNLTKGTTYKFYNTPSYSFDRWCKITLTSNRYITLTSNRVPVLLDSNGNHVTLSYDSTSDGKTTYKSSIKLAKGTYYVKLAHYEAFNSSEIITLKWS